MKKRVSRSHKVINSTAGRRPKPRSLPAVDSSDDFNVFPCKFDVMNENKVVMKHYDGIHRAVFEDGRLQVFTKTVPPAGSKDLADKIARVFDSDLDPDVIYNRSWKKGANGKLVSVFVFPFGDGFVRVEEVCACMQGLKANPLNSQTVPHRLLKFIGDA